MAVIVSILEHSRVPIEVREPLSFSAAAAQRLAAQISGREGVGGCVLLNTCNRTELYLSAAAPLHPGELLCQAAGVAYAPFSAAFVTLEQAAAVRHLMEVAAGLRSRVFGEDQILAQVKSAISDAREVCAANSELETLFRTAISAGKEIKRRVRLSPVPVSAAACAVELLRQTGGALAQKRVLVIGNGEMGRLTAQLLRDQGCRVTVTLRSYRRGQTIVPPGCRAIPYDNRYSLLKDTDILVSATASPHYTITATALAGATRLPEVMVDLSLPRDIDPAIAGYGGVRLFNLDDLRVAAPRDAIPPLIDEILARWEAEFLRWRNYRDCLPVSQELKLAVFQRLLHEGTVEKNADTEQTAYLAVCRTVDLLLGGLGGKLTPQGIEQCAGKIRAYTREK